MRKFTIEGRWVDNKPQYTLWEGTEIIPMKEDVRLYQVYEYLRTIGKIVDVTRLGDLYRHVKVEEG